MTDNEIIKALECCATDKMDDCFQCPYDNIVYKPGNGGCVNRCRKDALDLINRQKAEIERLNVELKAMRGAVYSYKLESERLLQKLQQAQSKAIKEFAERLKSKLDSLEFRTKTHRKTVPTKFCDDNVNWVLHECVPGDIDTLVKEMTEVEE